MKKIKSLLIVGIAALGVGVLAGCGGNKAEVDDGHKILFWSTFNATYQATIDKAITKMKLEHPEYTVVSSKVNGGYDDLKEAIIKGFGANDYPDMCVVYPDSVADFIMAAKAHDMTDVMDDPDIGWTDDDYADIPEAYIEEGRNYFVPGTYSLPLCKSTEAMYYNRDILIGLDLSSTSYDVNEGEPLDDEYIQSLTWEELFGNLCPAIMEYNDALPAGKKILNPPAEYASNWALVGYDSDDNLFITLAEQYGLKYTSINQETGVGSIDYVEKNADGSFKDVGNGYMDVVKLFTNAYKNKYFTTKGVIGKNVNYVSTFGGMLFSIGSTGGVSYQFNSSTHFDVGVAPVPQVDFSHRKQINQGPSISFLTRGINDAVIQTREKGMWLFYKYLTDTDLHAEWATQTGYSPIRTSSANTSVYLNYMDEESKALHTLDRLTARNAAYSVECGEYLFSSPVFYGSSKARTSVAGIFADIFKGSSKLDLESAQFTALVRSTFSDAYDNAI